MFDVSKLKVNERLNVDLHRRENMRIKKIASSTDYRMCEQF